MTPEQRLPAQIAAWARRQARAGARYTRAGDLWQAADRAHPGLLPSDPKPLSRDWPTNRDLIHAYLCGLPPVEVGDLVTLTVSDLGTGGRGTVTAVHSPGLLRVQLQHGTEGRPGPVIDTGRLRVEPVPVVFYTATIVTLDGSDTTADGEACEPGRGYRQRHGWWDPDRGYLRVHGDRGLLARTCTRNGIA
jgi:hypothetical protein